MGARCALGRGGHGGGVGLLGGDCRAVLHCSLSLQWHALSREEQAKYYELARKERQLHMQLYPGWSARDNYVSVPMLGTPPYGMAQNGLRGWLLFTKHLVLAMPFHGSTRAIEIHISGVL